MDRYDPDQAPDPEEWLALDERERLGLVEDYHASAGIELEIPMGHAAFHVIVENQLAERLDSAVRALDRLMAEGMDRHDAVHAIASVLAGQVYEIAGGESSQPDAQAPTMPSLKNSPRNRGTNIDFQ